MRLESDLVDICEAMLTDELSQTKIEWRPGNSACVVLAAEGYPYKPRTGDVIHGLEGAASRSNVTIFHAGTALQGGEAASKNGEMEPPVFVTAGGRVLGVTATGPNPDETLANAYSAVELIRWNGMQYRRDIGS